jgi:hypothetical protein
VCAAGQSCHSVATPRAKPSVVQLRACTTTPHIIGAAKARGKTVYAHTVRPFRLELSAVGALHAVLFEWTTSSVVVLKRT